MHGLVVVRGNGEVGWIVVSPGDIAPLDTANLNITHSAVSSWYRVVGMAGRPSPSPRPQQLQHLGLVRQHRQPWQPALQSHSYYSVGWEASLSTSNISILTVALKHSQYLSALKAISFNFLSPVVTAIGLKIYVLLLLVLQNTVGCWTRTLCSAPSASSSSSSTWFTTSSTITAWAAPAAGGGGGDTMSFYPSITRLAAFLFYSILMKM